MGRLGVTSGSVAGGDHALMFSSNHPFGDGEWERMHAMLDRIYEDFTAKVAEGRGLDRSEVEDLARGRVWTGADAKDRGLVDQLGGIERAIDLAKQQAGIAPDVEVDLKVLPRLGPLERLRRSESSEDATAAATRTVSAEGLRLAAWGQLAPLAATLGLPAAGPLILPGAWHVH
jgi:protease-4